MSFQVVYPLTMAIDGDSFKDAVKNFVKLNYDLNLASIIITDRTRYMRANLDYYNKDNKDKVGIKLLPTVWPLGGVMAVNSSNNEIISPLNMWPYSPTISFDTKEYPRSTFLDVTDFVPRIVPLVASATLGPLVSPLGPLAPPLISGIYPSMISYGKK
jgi:hypothetical protein